MRTRYTGPLKAAILDWAGTAVDFGSVAPVRALTHLFHNCGVPITEEEARQDMGLLKTDHIRSILAMPRVRDAWAVESRAAPSEADVERLFTEFVPIQL